MIGWGAEVPHPKLVSPNAVAKAVGAVEPSTDVAL